MHGDAEVQEVPSTGLFVGATTYEPDVGQVSVLVENLAATGCEAAVYDNSHSPETRALIAQLCAEHSIQYLSSGTNEGTAGALNALLARAAELGREWLLYFDQDSSPSAGFVARVEAVTRDIASDVALVGSRIQHRSDHKAQVPGQGVAPARFLIASGTVMRISALRQVAGFDETLFLDLVDHEMCLRLRRAGYRLLVDHERHIEHDIGAGSAWGPGKRLRVTRHPAWRRRLMWRNSLLLAVRYGRSAPSEVGRIVGGRVIETLASFVHFKDGTFLTTAVSGVSDAVSELWRSRGRGTRHGNGPTALRPEEGEQSS